MKKQTNPNDIILKIRRIRGELSQTEFAKRVGINRSLISSYESGKRFPSFSSLQKLADYGEVSIDYLSGENNGLSCRVMPEEGEIIFKLRKLSPESKVLFDNLLEKLTDGSSLKQNQKARKTRLY